MMDPEQTWDQVPEERGESPGPTTSEDVPQRIGRYQVERILGRGGFGLVYLAFDDQLRRLVAIKVPLGRHVAKKSDAEAYLREARTVAALDHPNIVPVHDVGSTEVYPCFVVSKYIDGTDLAARIKAGVLSTRESVELVATVADALHHAHKRGLVHRDIKPGNILLDSQNKPYISDFGLALREQDIGRGPRHAGTPAYMSPEQARGEGHRVDGRSDIFSLGVVFYELLVRKRPFRGDTQEELLEQIKSAEPRPPRQVDDSIPREIERICLKAFAKRASERYSTAKDLAEDLKHFLAETPSPPASHSTAPPESSHLVVTPAIPPGSTPGPLHPPSSSIIKIVPKGLRSFDSGDADFFLELMQGPRDREGLPESIRFWKARIESPDPDLAFHVGLIYGPSGCGKTSMVRAGLVPRLGKSVRVAYSEASSEGTESRLLRSLRRQVPALPDGMGLSVSLAEIRRGRFLPQGQKVLLILDQFEQWLHARGGQDGGELVDGLRQCDGERLQCLILVRDDFWLAVSRFMQALEVRLVEGGNSRLVDLFDSRHARRVLSSFGKALGALPEGSLDKDQELFLQKAVEGLAQEGKIISVRLAIFAEMTKGKPWNTSTLKSVGGAEGVGVNYLEETFNAPTAPPRNRLHQKAAQGVLRALLPEGATDIKGHVLSRKALLAASGYARRPGDFEDLLRLLDAETRLITPTDTEGKDGAQEDRLAEGERYYQLTHDFLVPSIREWLNRKRRETARGRAELLLEERAGDWKAKPETRNLPTLPQWVQIRSLTSPTGWTQTQSKMMAKATRRHRWRALAALILVVASLFAWRELNGAWKARELRDRLHDANTADSGRIVAEMNSYAPWAIPLLRVATDNAEIVNDRRKALNNSLGLHHLEGTQTSALLRSLPDAKPVDAHVIGNALARNRGEVLDTLWAEVAASGSNRQNHRLAAAAVLSKIDPENATWEKVTPQVAADLVSAPPVYLAEWMESLKGISGKLVPKLAVLFRDPGRGELERSMAADALASFAGNDPEILSGLLMDAVGKQFLAIFPALQSHPDKALSLLEAEIRKTTPAGVPASDPGREVLAKRQANAAVALFRMGLSDRLRPLLRQEPDPRTRSYLINRLPAFGADPAQLAAMETAESDLSIRRALLLALSGYDTERLPEGLMARMQPRLRVTWLDEKDPGLRSAAECLLLKWGDSAWLKEDRLNWLANKPRREKSFQTMQGALRSGGGAKAPLWYTNTLGQTMIVAPGPLEFRMGSPDTENDRSSEEVPHTRKINRSFAIAAKALSLDDYGRLVKEKLDLIDKYATDPRFPASSMNWKTAAAFCNLLSAAEGIPKEQWCYETDDKGQVTGMRENFLDLTGYRLPTAAEMEYMTRAGTITSRHYGETDELLADYAWFGRNSRDMIWPVGVKLPNDFGLFDTLGNCFTWCQDPFIELPESATGSTIVDQSAERKIDWSVRRALKGGSFTTIPANIRSAYRLHLSPNVEFANYGFRPARTIRP